MLTTLLKPTGGSITLAGLDPAKHQNEARKRFGIVKDMQGFQIIMNFLVMPIFVLSGALFPISILPRALTILTMLDPLSYGIDGLRTELIAVSHFGAPLDAGVLVIAVVAFLALGTHLMSKIEI